MKEMKNDIKQIQKEKRKLKDSSKQMIVKDNLKEKKKEVEKMKQEFEQKINT